MKPSEASQRLINELNKLTRGMNRSDYLDTLAELQEEVEFQKEAIQQKTLDEAAR